MTVSTPPLPFVSIRDLALNPAHSVVEGLLYPKRSQSAGEPLLRQRLQELERLGVEGFFDTQLPNAKRLGKWHALGLGYRGVVLLALWRGKTVALKLRRTDLNQADVTSLLPEAKALQLANGVGVGPTCWSAGEHCIAMDWVRGDRFIDWVYRAPDDPGYPADETVRVVLLQLADSSFRLDQLGLDHGELNCVASHVLVPEGSGEPPVIIDFSQASRGRRPANVTALVQGLLIGTSIPKALARRFCLPEKEEAIARLRAYKQEPNEVNFARVRSLLESCATLRPPSP